MTNENDVHVMIYNGDELAPMPPLIDDETKTQKKFGERTPSKIWRNIHNSEMEIKTIFDFDACIGLSPNETVVNVSLRLFSTTFHLFACSVIRLFISFEPETCSRAFIEHFIFYLFGFCCYLFSVQYLIFFVEEPFKWRIEIFRVRSLASPSNDGNYMPKSDVWTRFKHKNGERVQNSL